MQEKGIKDECIFVPLCVGQILAVLITWSHEGLFYKRCYQT